jgi:hypothetical protein
MPQLTTAKTKRDDDTEANWRIITKYTFLNFETLDMQEQLIESHD